MSAEIKPTIPTTTAVGSAFGANNLVVDLPLITGKSYLIHGVTVSYTGTAGGPFEITSSVASGSFDYVFNAAAEGNAPSHNFAPAPIKTTETSSVQLSCTQPGGTDDGRATIRYSVSN